MVGLRCLLTFLACNMCARFSRSERGGVESLVEASTAEAEAISAALAAAEAKSRHQKEEFEPHGPDRDRGAEATPSGKPPSSPSSAALISMNGASMATTPVQTPPTGVRLHHRAVIILLLFYEF